VSRPEWIVVGHIQRAHGLDGEVRVVSDSDNPDRFAKGSAVFCRARGNAALGVERSELTVAAVRPTTGALLISFAGVADRTAAEALRGCLLEVPISSLPVLPEGEYYPFELAGLRVEDEDGRPVGEVLELLDTPAHPVLSLRLADGGDLLVPFTMEAVPTVDVAGERLVVLRRFVG